jgi:hypothetical protein
VFLILKILESAVDRFSVFQNQKIERWGGAMLRLLSRFLRALFQFSKRAAGEATKFGRSGVKLLGVVGSAISSTFMGRS